MKNPKEKVISCSNCISISDKKLHMNLQKYGGNRLASESNLSLTWSLIKCNGVVSKQIQSIFFYLHLQEDKLLYNKQEMKKTKP